MKKMLVFLLTAGLLLTQAVVYAQSDQTATKAPPVSQPLVREGDLAVKLVEVLKIGTANNETEAETMLGASGVVPKNGWIADYPVTPDIMGELQKAVSEAADAKRLAMGKEEALKAFRTATVEAGIPIVAELSSKYPENQPQYAESSAVDDYYSTEGPPVVTYYPPPPDYGYLYAWVPCPFFFDAFFFPGFFVLHDFHRVVIFANKVVVVSNHVISPVNHTVVVIDPPTRATGKTLTTTSVTGKSVTSASALQRTSTTGFSSPDTKKAATSILQRSQQRLGTSGATGMTGRTKSFGMGTVSPSATGRTMGSNHAQTPKTGANLRSSGGEGRPVNTPNLVGGRSFSEASTSRSFGSSGRSFSAPNRSFSSPSIRSGGSFGGRDFGGFSSGFHGGGHGGGCRGRC